MKLSRRWLAVTVVLSLGWGAARLPALVVLPAPRALLAALNNDTMERFACMYGGTSNGISVVTHAEPGILSRKSRGGHYWITEVSCPRAALGLAHNHPYGEKCWYFFPTTVFPTSDEVSFLASGDALSVIVCREQLVWQTQ